MQHHLDLLVLDVFVLQHHVDELRVDVVLRLGSQLLSHMVTPRDDRGALGQRERGSVMSATVAP